jgi:putative spermidine/putrescine transport system permease protein
MYKRYKPYFLLIPFLLVMFSIFLIGLLNGLLQSFGYIPTMNLKDPTWKYYVEVLSDKYFVEALLYTLYIAFLSSAVSVAAGVFLAFLIERVKGERFFAYDLLQVPIIIPHIVVVLFTIYFFSQTGILSRICNCFMPIEDPGRFPLLIYDTGSFGIIFVYLFKQIPFVALTVYAILKNLNKNLGNVAENLGASKLQSLIYIKFPLLLPSIISSFLITFAFDFGAFEVPFLLGSPAKHTLPVKAFIDYTNPDFTSRPYTMVTNILISFISILIIYGHSKAFNYFSKHGMEGKIL